MPTLKNKLMLDEQMLEKEQNKDGPDHFAGWMLEELKEKVVNKAEIERDKYEFWAEILKWINIALFVAGSVLGLVAKWAGIDAPNGG